MVGGAKSHLESNPIPTRELGGLKKTLCAPEPRDPTETEPELCLSVSCAGTGQQWPAAGEGLWVQQTWVWHKPSGRRSPFTPPQSPQNLHKTGKQTLGGHKQNLVHTSTQEKGGVTPQETDPDSPVSDQESPAEVWVSGGLLQGQGH